MSRWYHHIFFWLKPVPIRALIEEAHYEAHRDLLTAEANLERAVAEVTALRQRHARLLKEKQQWNAEQQRFPSSERLGNVIGSGKGAIERVDISNPPNLRPFPSPASGSLKTPSSDTTPSKST